MTANENAMSSWYLLSLNPWPTRPLRRKDGSLTPDGEAIERAWEAFGRKRKDVEVGTLVLTEHFFQGLFRRIGEPDRDAAKKVVDSFRRSSSRRVGKGPDGERLWQDLPMLEPIQDWEHFQATQTWITEGFEAVLDKYGSRYPD